MYNIIDVSCWILPKHDLGSDTFASCNSLEKDQYDIRVSPPVFTRGVSQENVPWTNPPMLMWKWWLSVCQSVILPKGCMTSSSWKVDIIENALLLLFTVKATSGPAVRDLLHWFQIHVIKEQVSWKACSRMSAGRIWMSGIEPAFGWESKPIHYPAQHYLIRY